MYERSVIVLERYMEDILGLNKQNNLKNNFYTYKEMVEEVRVYQNMLAEEEDILQKFDEIAKKLQGLQQEQEIIYKNNGIAEEQRFNLFSDLDIRPDILEKKLIRIESQIDKNNDDLKQIRRDYVETLETFIERQKNSSICARKKKGTDANHLATIKKTKQLFDMIEKEDLKRMKNFVDGDKRLIKEQIFNIMIDNGKNERVPFNEDIIKHAIDIRMDIATKEAKCYITVYDKLRKLLAEIEDDNLPLSKYEKTLRDISVKLRFFDAEKDYIVGFLDNERMTAINGEVVHDKMMKEACSNFEKDIVQINNLYELIKKETLGKANDKDYNNLYNNTYLHDIEADAKSFEKQITNVNISVGAVINSNYWRIEGIKNIYTVFSEEIPQKFGRDLSIYEEEEYGEGYEIEQAEEDEEVQIARSNIYEEDDDDDGLGNLEKYEHEDELEYQENLKEQEDEEEYDDYEENIKYDEEKNQEEIEEESEEEIIEDDEEIFEEEEEDPLEFGRKYEKDYNKRMEEIEEEKKKRNIRAPKVKIKNIKPKEEKVEKQQEERPTRIRRNIKIRRPTVSNTTEQQNKIDEFMKNINEEELEKKEKENFINKLLKMNKDKILKSS